MSNQNKSWHERLHDTMPHGSSTTSKNPVYIPDEPEVIARGKGCRVWDDKGREFIDFRNSLGPITLGYCYPEVDEAIKAQMENGIIYGHPTALEAEVSEMLCERIPCAEQARFLKTGGEACSAAIYIARAYTGKDHIIQIGYNGWLNTLGVGAKILPNQTSMAKPGVPAAVSALYHPIGWNNKEGIEALFDEYNDNIAAIIVAADYANFEAGKTFYPWLREITKKHGALLILDEIVTGFRVALGGVQEYFGFKPDLCVYAKGIANGMPLSVYAGTREVMKTCEMPGFSISSTYGGETLSLAACRAVMQVHAKHNVIGHIWEQGNFVWGELDRMFVEKKIPVRMTGVAPCKQITIQSDAPADMHKRLFSAAYRNGVSFYNTCYVNFSHKREDLEEVLQRMDRATDEL